jgi:hypothetical protein
MNFARIGIFFGWFILASLANADDWKIHRADKDGFSVQFPGTPRRIQNTIPTVYGPVQLVFHGLSVENRALFASFYDLPASWNGDPEKAIDAERDRGLKNTGCNLVSEKPVQVAGVTGRDVVADQSSGTQRVRCRNFVLGHRLFSLIVIGPKDETVDAVAKEFFESFSLLPSP